MKNLRLPLAALLAPLSLGILLCAEVAQATLALDPAFGTDGIAALDIAAGPDVARRIAVQADGALVLAGRSRQTAGPDTIDYVALTRLDGTTGAVDATFGTAGTVTFLPGLAATNGGGGDGNALTIQPVDQKIIVAGFWKDSQAADSEVFVARFDASGVLDAGFGTGGVALLTPAGVTNPIATAIALRSDGSIVVVGTGTATGTTGVGFVIVLDSAGAPDPGFTPAVVPNPLPAPGGANFGFNAVAVLSGDGIIVAGGGGDLTLAQYTSTGAPDTSFAGDGIATFNYLSFDGAESVQSTFDVITAMTVLSDGRILVAGGWGENSTSTATNPFLGRVTSSGTLDSTFGSGGYAPLGITGGGNVPYAVKARPSGDIVLVGPRLTPTQVSPNGIAVSELAGTLAATLQDLDVLGDGSVVAAGQRVVTGANTEFAAVRLTATDLADGPDTVPDPFTFATQTDVEPGIPVKSNTITITGLDAPAPISVGSGGEYSKGCTTTFVSTAGVISDGETVCVRNGASQSDSTVKYLQLFIGGVQGLFTLVTGDATPDAFTFVDQTSVPVNDNTITSNTIELTGLTTRTDVSITGAGSTYSVGCFENFTAGVTRVNPGAEICVRHTSSATAGAVTTTTLTVGVGTKVSAVFKSTTIGDTTPDAFSFVDQTGVAKSTVITSASVTLAGFDSDAPISVSGGQYSIGCTDETFTATAGTVAPNATVCVRHTSSAAGGTTVSTTLAVGPPGSAVSDTFTSTTEGTPDTTPEAFSFVDQTSTPLATVITSGGITIGGFDTNTTISVTGGTYSVGCGTNFTANAGTFAPNTLVCVRHTSASTGGTATNTVLTVGGVSDTFTSTTLAGDAIPNAFSFTDQTGVDLSASVTSAPVTITGIDIASPISVTGGEYSIGCTSTFTATAANISNGQTVCVQQTSSFDGNTSVDTTLTIGTVSDTFTSTTKAGDQTPDDFTFESQPDVALETLTTSNTITVEGVDSPVAVIASGGPRDSSNRPLYGFSVGCTGTFDGSNGDLVDPGETLCIGVVSASTDSTGVVVTVTIGGSAPGSQTSATFTVTTGDTVPDPFTFTDRVGVLLGETVNSDPITITGITGPSKVEITQNGQYQIDCVGDFTGRNGLVSNGQKICVRQIAASSLATLTDTVLTVGGVSDTFTSTTVVDKPLPGSSAMDGWSLLLLAPLVGYRRRRSAFRRDSVIDRA